MKRDYILKIRASDWGSPFRRQAEMILRVKLKDINDHRPSFEKVDCISYVSKHAFPGTEIFTFSAIDFDAGSLVSYKMVPSNDDPCFHLDPKTGVLSVTCDLSHQHFKEKILNVSATDGTHFAETMGIVIKIVSKDKDQRIIERDSLVECKDAGVTERLKEQIRIGEANNRKYGEDELSPIPSRYAENKYSPEFFSSLPNEISINESFPIGTSILKLEAIDQDTSYNGKVIFVISAGNDDSCFKIDLYTGKLIIISFLDREKRDRYILNISVFDLGHPQKSSSKTLIVNILDVNDNAPKFERNFYNFEISEATPSGSSIVRLLATDNDSGLNAEISFSILTDTKDFIIDSQSGVLTVNSKLDRERQEYYNLNIQVMDHAPIYPMSSTTMVSIKLLDINDNPPQFSNQLYWIKIREDLPMGTVLIILSAQDPDLDEGGQIEYKILSGAEGKFEIDPKMGVVRLTHSLDFEQKQIYNASVGATDGGGLQTVIHLVIEVEDVPENNFQGPTFPDVVQEAEVDENQPPGTEVVKLNVSSRTNGHLFFTIRGGDGMGLFAIDNQGLIKTRVVLDREASAVHWLDVWAWERGPTPSPAKLFLAVHVRDNNDNIPLTHAPLYRPRILENSPSGTTVLKLDAFDLDAPEEENPLTFQISAGDPQHFFQIDPHSGLIKTTSRRLNRENRQEHILDVVVSDTGSPQLSSTTRVVVTIADENDNEPSFLNLIYRCYMPLPQNSTEDVFVCQISAFDQDDGLNSDLDYSILDPLYRDVFRIHPKNGALYAMKTLVEGKLYEFTVEARDNGTPRKSGTTRVLVEGVVLSSSSNHPPFYGPLEVNPLVVSEGDKVGHLLDIIPAEDPDGDRLWHRIEGGNTDDAFMINTVSGAIFLVKRLDWEVKNSYNLTLSVSDGIYRVFTAISITVMDVNDHSPEFSKDTYSITIPENTPPGTKILTLEAFDRDEDKRVYYELFNSAFVDSLHRFSLDSTQGVIRVAQQLDHETTRKHILTVAATDSGTPSKRSLARVLITVEDRNDHAPEFLSTLFEGLVFDTAALGTAVVQVLCIDRDKGENAQITFTIVSGNVGNAFSIDPQLGIISVAQELNQRTMPEYFLVVRATDHGTPALNSTVTVHIIVTISDNAPPRFELDVYIKEIYEDLKVGSPILALVTFSQSSVLYEIVSGNDEGVFTVNPTSGLVSIRGQLDYERTRTYVLTVSATNLVNANSSTLVTIHVLDVNDNAPVFVQEDYVGKVSEAAKPGSLLLQASNSSTNAPLVVMAQDADSDFNAQLSFSIVEKHASAFFTIDTTTGAISTARSLDYETASFFEFSVQVTDRGTPRLSSGTLARIHVTVEDVNDSPPWCEPASGTVFLPSYRGVIVTHLTCGDSDTKSTLKYSLVSGNYGDKFALDPDSAILSIKNPENLRDQYDLVASCHDGLFETTTPIKISVFNSQNSQLKFSKEKYEAEILENTTEVVTVAIIMVLGTELNDHIEFKILNQINLFEIGLTSGVIQTTGKMFDREIQSKYTLVVEATCETYSSTTVAHVLVEVTILDVNDNAPIFINLPYYSVVPIEAKKDYIVRKVHAIDLDAGPNSYIHYELVAGDAATFHVDKQSGLITLLKAVSPHIADHTLIVAAVDNGTPPLRTSVQVPIRIINQDMPVFKKQFYNVSIPENLPLTIPVLKVTAESPQNRQLIYSLPVGNELEEFMVDFKTEASLNTGPCVLYIVKELDYETTSKYHLILRATDAVTGSSADLLININVEDVNDNPPIFTQHSYNASVSEGSSIGTTLLQVHATDVDTQQRITYLLVGNDSSSFYIEPTEGIIFVKQPLDYETRTVHHFSVRAEDGGGLSSTANVWISVTDANDNPPVFSQPSYRCEVSDTAQRGQFVTRLVASDRDPTDQPRLVYSIVDGNELQTFTIDPSSGIISISSIHQFNQKSSYALNVSVTDGVYSTHAQVLLEVRGGNRHAPRFTRTVYEVAVKEEEPPGAAVVTVMATDQDSGEYARVTYLIHSEECKKYFDIDSDTGQVVTKVSLDREERHLYELPVVAVDGGWLLDYATVRVTVTNVNDHSPQFMVSEYRTTISSNITVGTTILKVQAFDEDERESKLDYILHENTNSSAILDLFGLSPREGVIYLKKSLASYEKSAFQFFVQAQDEGVPPFHTYVPVNVAVQPPEAIIPHFEKPTYEFFLSEKDPIGTLIAVLTVQSSEPVKFSFVTPAKGSASEKYIYNFSIDDKGRIFLMSPLDRESRPFYLVTARVETRFSSIIATAEVRINVMDENDNAPVFESDPYVMSIAENVPKGSTILKVAASDRDDGENGAVSYWLGASSDIANVFHLDSRLGWLTTMAPLDREAVSHYNFTVIARDNGDPPRSSTTSISIAVEDYNDNPPYFERDQYETAINEDALLGTIIVTLETKDPDENAIDPVAFYIVNGDLYNQFLIRENGDVCVNKPLDREKINSYLLEVIGTDGIFIAKTTIYIDVLDANDNPPVCLKDRYTEVVSESISLQTYILTVAAADADERRNAQLWFTLEGEGLEDFIIDSASGMVKTARQLDRERQPRYNLLARVRDRGRPEWTCHSTIEIYVSDVNDNAPAFTQAIYSIAVPEDTPVGSLLTKVHASDLDLGASRRVSYYLMEPSEHFEVGERSGLVRLSHELDREMVAIWNVSVRATDHGTPRLSASALLSITVLDVNDNPPEFTRNLYAGAVPESASPGTEVARLLAVSRDTGVNADISYSIVAGDPFQQFAIHPKTGAVTVAQPLDYERMPNYELTVEARDGGSPPLSSRASLNITVLDINDNPPIFLQEHYMARIAEDVPVGEVVQQVLATDADSFPFRQLHYSIINGDRFNQFFINPETGYITVANPLDREMVANYALEVKCEDSGEPPLSATTKVIFEITDINDNAPVFSQVNYTTIVQEGKPLGHTVLKFTVMDADIPPNTTPFTFTFLSGNEDNAFRLVQQDATLRTASRFDRGQGEYLLHIQVADNGSPPLASSTWVTVLVIEESRFPPTVTPLTAVLTSYLDDFPGGLLGRVHASDRDPYDKVTFEMASSHHHLFRLDRDDGTLTALPGLDVGRYNISITVSDGKFTTMASVLVTVNLITEDALLNALSIQFYQVTPEDFFLTYQKSFVKALRNMFNVRIKDIEILSIQPTFINASPKNTPPEVHNNSQDVDVLFVIHKGSQSYYSPKIILTKLREKKETFESNVGLKIVKVFESRCQAEHCANSGVCFDRLVLDRTHVTSITTETLSFISPQHFPKLECVCEIGFGGSRCELVINECAHKPCAPHQECVVDSTVPLGYTCQCPFGKTGPACDQPQLCGEAACYHERTPMAFQGRSYARYSLSGFPSGADLMITLNLRTIKPLGTLVYLAGTETGQFSHYSILEMVHGVVHYRTESGMGEGVVSAEGPRVDDGHWHEVCLERRGQLAELAIDKNYRTTGTLPGNGDWTNTSLELFFGAQVYLKGNFEPDIQQGFIGCLDNLRMDRRLLPLHAASHSSPFLKQLSNVEFGCQNLFTAGPCRNQPCQNGGSCIEHSEGDVTWSCRCLPRFTGPTCEVDTEPCASGPCLYGGTCTPLHNDFHCHCPERLSGKRCDYGRFCNPNPCLNKGLCTEGLYNAICKCKGFQGDRCQYDLNECHANPCSSGATCINFHGSFHCQCPPNMTGPLCAEQLFSHSITSTSWNTTPEEIIGIIVVILFIFLIATILACCCRCRNKHRQSHQNNRTNDDIAASEFMLKNSMLDKDHMKRLSKISNMEVSSLTTPPLPPRPTSYTPSTQEAINTLNKLDTVRSYGSAADDLENLTRYTSPSFLQNINKASLPPSLSPPPPSESENGNKGSWDQNLPKDIIYQDKIQNTDLGGGFPTSVLNALSPNSAPKVAFASTTAPPSVGLPSVQALASVDDLTAVNMKMPSLKVDAAKPGYHWDCSDWTGQRLEANITEVAPSVVPSTASSLSNLSQTPLSVGLDETKYHKHPDLYLPSHSPKTTWTNQGDTSDDEVVAYGFPPQGGQGYRFKPNEETAIPPNPGLYLEDYNTSFSDSSTNVICGIDDAEVEYSDVNCNAAKNNLVQPKGSSHPKTKIYTSSAVI